MTTTERPAPRLLQSGGVHDQRWEDEGCTATEALLAAVPLGHDGEVAIMGSCVSRVRVGGQQPVDETSSITTTSIRLASRGRRAAVVIDGLPRTASAVSDAMTLAKGLLAPAHDGGPWPFFDPSSPRAGASLPVAEPRSENPGGAAGTDAWYDPSSAVSAAEVRRQLADVHASLDGGGMELTKGIGYAGGATSIVVGNTAGVLAAFRTSVCHYGTTALVEGPGGRVALYGFRSARGVDALDAEELVLSTAAAARLLATMPEPLPPNLPVVLDAPVTAEFLHVVGRAAASPSRYRQRSFLSNATYIDGAEGLTIVDDPTDPGAINGVLVDGEGAATRPVPLIENGVVRPGLTTWVDADELALPHTASAMRPLDGPPRAAARSVRLAAAPAVPMPDERVRISEVRGFSVGFDLENGSFSLLVRGFVERGDEQTPIGLLTLTGDMPSLLAGLSLPADGRRLEYGSTGALGDVVIVAPGALGFTAAPTDGGLHE